MLSSLQSTPDVAEQKHLNDPIQGRIFQQNASLADSRQMFAETWLLGRAMWYLSVSGS